MKPKKERRQSYLLLDTTRPGDKVEKGERDETVNIKLDRYNATRLLRDLATFVHNDRGIKDASLTVSLWGPTRRVY